MLLVDSLNRPTATDQLFFVQRQKMSRIGQCPLSQLPMCLACPWESKKLQYRKPRVCDSQGLSLCITDSWCNLEIPLAYWNIFMKVSIYLKAKNLHIFFRNPLITHTAIFCTLNYVILWLGKVASLHKMIWFLVIPIRE